LKVQGFILYKIYYESGLVYLGRTKQPLQDRIRGHLFKKPMHRSIDINLVTKIEYANFRTESDMFIYEVYYINKYKPPLNADDKARDEVTIDIPDVAFVEFSTHLWDSWKNEINSRASDLSKKYDEYYEIREKRSLLRSQFKMGVITREKLQDLLDEAAQREEYLRKEIYG
jgi:hypothetical protein